MEVLTNFKNGECNMSQDSNQKTWLDRLVDPALRNKINVRKFNAALNTENSIVKVMYLLFRYTTPMFNKSLLLDPYASYASEKKRETRTRKA